MNGKNEYGDFQTPEKLAKRVVSLVAELFGTPDVVIEPSVGRGSFLAASAAKWETCSKYLGYEINKEYVDLARRSLSQFNAQIFHRDFFTEDWAANVSQFGKARVLIIGNPPWITNSDLGQLRSDNLPKKSNFQGLRGLEARTGKSNFDIAEWMLIRLIEALPPDGAIAMLCKTMTARKVLRHFWKTDGGREGSRLFCIDAKAEFGVAVDACLLFANGKRTGNRTATVYDDLDTKSSKTRFGFIDGDLVSDLDSYQERRHLDGGSSVYTWRSGIKHDAAKVMEFARDGYKLVNGFGEIVDIEGDYVFPLLKSSDLGNGRIVIRKEVLVTQRHTGDDTAEIKRKAPKTWKYLMRHADALDGRRSSIYENRPRFSIFGIGPYSYAPWKVAISGLYKKISFVLVPPCGTRPVMVDDTCYSIPCQSKEEAELLYALLSSSQAIDFLNALVFVDSKRPITIDVLRRLSIVELARHLEKFDELARLVKVDSATEKAGTQILLLMEPELKYRTKRIRQHPTVCG
jgi:hypothetical protein